MAKPNALEAVAESLLTIRPAAYINAAISPEVQTKMAEEPYLVVPTSSRAAP